MFGFPSCFPYHGKACGREKRLRGSGSPDRDEIEKQTEAKGERVLWNTIEWLYRCLKPRVKLSFPELC